MQSAVLFLIFNRPDTTRLVFEKIRQAKPPRLYISADGARSGKTGEAEKCKWARQIATAVDWPCEVQTNFRDTNVGCKIAVSEGISWFFEHEERGIILEDDCLPDATFFRYCDELLIKYDSNNAVWHIAGFSIENNLVQTSYRFSHLIPIWGWATWRRAWKNYDREMISFSETANQMYDCFGKSGKYVKQTFKNHIQLNVNTWDTQWAFTCVKHQAFSILPSKSLITNIGFHADATHTTTSDMLNDAITATPMQFPLKHADIKAPTRELDEAYLKKYFPNPYMKKIKKLLKRIKL
jgi:hypothetical protein